MTQSVTRIIATVAVGLTASIAGIKAQAQVPAPLSIGVSAGPSVPIGDLSNVTGTGYEIAGHVGIDLPALPISFRGDVGYDRWSAKSGNGDGHAFSITANALVHVPIQSALHPYIIGGVGGYRFGVTVNDTARFGNNDNRFGYNVGAGVNLPVPGFDTFVEGRYTHINSDVGNLSFVPITIGVMF